VADSPFGRPTPPPRSVSASVPARATTAVARSRARPRRRWLPILLVALGLFWALVGAWVYAFKLTTVVAEKALIVALFSRVPPVQRVAIQQLRGYPTRHAAIALVAFINLKNLQEMPDPKKPDTPEDKARRRAQRVRDLALAERATETLCLLSGQSFGTYFKRERYGHSWGSLSEEKWPTVLGSVDRWALETFGPGAGS
jgi:hypothetical protein